MPSHFRTRRISKKTFIFGLSLMAAACLTQPLVARIYDGAEPSGEGKESRLMGLIRQWGKSLSSSQPTTTRVPATKPKKTEPAPTLEVKAAPQAVAVHPADPPAAGGHSTLSSLPCGCSDEESTFVLRANALWMQRSRPNGAAIALGVDAADFHFDFEPGWEISGLWNLGNPWSAEIRYFQVIDWNDRIFVEDGDDTLDTLYSSELRSLELNLRKQQTGWLSLLAGLRYINLEETLNITQTGILVEEGFVLTQELNTRNHLYGLQIGLDARVWRCCPFSIDGIIKAGLAWNDASIRSVTTFKPAGSPAEGFIDSDRVDDGHLAFFVEAGLTGVYQITEKLALRGGYHVLLIDGVYLASEHLSPGGIVIPPNPPDPVDEFAAAPNPNTGTVFYHGFHLGLELRW